MSTITPTTGVFDDLDEERKIYVQLVVSVVRGYFEGGDWPRAKEEWHNHVPDMEPDEYVACTAFFDARQRAYLFDSPRKYLDAES